MKKKVFFIGIGGIGMSALARWFTHNGYEVSGSDAAPSRVIQELRREGIPVRIGTSARHVPHDAERIIYTMAAPRDHPERRRAAALGIRLQSYPEALGELTRRYPVIAIAGAHGKSTTTALLSLAFIHAKRDPTVIIGTKLREFKEHNFRQGKDQFLILEADEHNAAFLNYAPRAAIITNIDREHLDYYKNLSRVKKAYLEFVNRIQEKGILVVNQDNPPLYSLRTSISKIAKKRKLRVIWYRARDPRAKIIVNALRQSLLIPGEHNLSNALAVHAMARAFGIKHKLIIEALSKYRGAWRRMEYRGKLNLKNSKLETAVYDDYAHHPTEIRATLAGIAQKWPKSAILCVFEPHQIKRLALLFKEFTGAFDNANGLIILPIYKVVGRDRKKSQVMSRVELSHNITSKTLAAAIERRIKNKRLKPLKLAALRYVPSFRGLRAAIAKMLRESFPRYSSCIIVMMGAGGIVNHTASLLHSKITIRK